MYNPNRLEWHLGDEIKVRTPQVSVWSCTIASESFDFDFNRLAVALAKSQDHRASCGVFVFGRPNDSRYATGPAWAAKSEYTDTAKHPAACRPALIERLVKDWVQRWKQGPFYKRINPSSALGLFVFLRCFEINFEDKRDEHKDGERWYIHPWRTYG